MTGVQTCALPISQCIHITNLHIVYFKYLTTLFVNYTSIKLKKDKTNNEILLHQLPVDSHLTESKSQRLYRKSSTGKCSLTFLYLSNHTYHSLPNHMASLPGKHPLHGVCTTSTIINENNPLLINPIKDRKSVV